MPNDEGFQSASQIEIKDKKIIGLTGIYCSGKNHVARILERRGLPVLDLDKLGHSVIESEKERVLARFGKDILGQDFRIDRKKLGAKVFGKAGEMAALEEIIHPAVNRETLAWINSREEKVCVVNAALLHRSMAFNFLKAIIIVEAPFLVRLFRARKRDNLPWTAIIKRFRSQKNFHPQYFAGKADTYRVENSGFSGKKLESRIDEILSFRGIMNR
jgi:dephospho-CoA kinase